MDYGKYRDVVAYAQSVLDAYDFAHTCRVLNYALQILDDEKNADDSVVILAAILHDVGRGGRPAESEKLLAAGNVEEPEKATANGNADGHAGIGGERSKAYLIEQGYAEELAERVANCILTHGSGSDAKPRTKEAKILFDADKLDKTGAVGAVRAAIECKLNEEPLYALGDDGLPTEGKKEETISLLWNYRQKLRKLEKVFYTDKAKKIATKHRDAMDRFFAQLTEEVEKNYKKGNKLLEKYRV